MMLQRFGKVARGSNGVLARGFASQPGLETALPGMPELQPAGSRPAPTTQVTTLDNGLIVASEENFDSVTAFGMFVNAGSSYETDKTNGTSHLLEHMAFKSTETRSHLRLVRDIEDIGGQMASASAREFMLYQGECLRDSVDAGMDILADTLLRPKLSPWDLDEQRKVIGYELEEMESNAQSVLTEVVHAAAYGESSPLGRPLWCPKRNLNKLGEAELKEYMDTQFTASNMVLSAAGIEHERLVELANKYFADLKKGTKSAPAESPYFGGDRRVIAESPLTHVALAFDAGGWNSEDLLEICTLHMLLGGGSSFSSGGPGKGLYSRLYTNVLNKHHYIDSCSAYNSLYSQSGLVGCYGTSLPQDAGRLVDIMADELLSIASAPPSPEETNRAKNQLKSSVLMKLESRHTLFEDIGRQLLTYGKRTSGPELCKQIDAVTADGIQKVAQKALKSPVTVACFGELSSIPNYDVIANRFK